MAYREAIAVGQPGDATHDSVTIQGQPLDVRLLAGRRGALQPHVALRIKTLTGHTQIEVDYISVTMSGLGGAFAHVSRVKTLTLDAPVVAVDNVYDIWVAESADGATTEALLVPTATSIVGQTAHPHAARIGRALVMAAGGVQPFMQSGAEVFSPNIRVVSAGPAIVDTLVSVDNVVDHGAARMFGRFRLTGNAGETVTLRLSSSPDHGEKTWVAQAPSAGQAPWLLSEWSLPMQLPELTYRVEGGGANVNVWIDGFVFEV